MRHSMLVPLQLLTRTEHPPVNDSRAGDMYYNTKIDMVFVFNEDTLTWQGLKGAGSEEVVIQRENPSTDAIAANDQAELWVDTDAPGGAAGGGGGYLPLYGGILTGPLTITPTDPLSTALNITTGGVYIEAGGATASNFTPTLDAHLTTKEYVDALVAAGGGGPGTGTGGPDEIMISSAEPTDPALEMWIDTTTSGVAGADEIVISPTPPDDPSLEVWIDPTTPVSGLDATFVNVTGDTMTGQLYLVGDPTGPTEAATKNYVDTHGSGMSEAAADARYVNVTGDILKGPIDMGMYNVIFRNGTDAVRLGLLQSFPGQVGYPTFKVELFDDTTTGADGLVSLEVRADGVMVPEPTLLTDATTLSYVNNNFARVTVSTLEPASPNTGDIWIFHTP